MQITAGIVAMMALISHWAQHNAPGVNAQNPTTMCPGSLRVQLRGVILAARRGPMRAYLTVAGMAFGLVALWAALVPLLA
jgi:hypothetical protein